MSEKPRIVKCIEVYWVDSCASHGWQHISDLNPRPSMILSVGILISDEPEAITLAASRNEEGGVDSPITIPRECIKSVKTFKRTFPEE